MLITTLEPMANADGEQEITGIAVPVFEAAIDANKAEMADDPVVQATVGAYQHEIETGEPVRAFDALLVARQLDAAIGPRPMPQARAFSPAGRRIHQVRARACRRRPRGGRRRARPSTSKS